MFSKLLLLVALCSASPILQSNCNDPYNDRLCGEDLTKLWLDVVIVVDNSKGMTNRGISAVAADISSLFVDGQVLGNRANEPRTTRVGLITYNTGATLVADLNAFTSQEQLAEKVSQVLNKATDATEAYLETGLEKAGDLLEKQSFNSARDHYRKLIIVYASEYKGTGQLDPLPISMRLKESGIAIATVAYEQDNSDSFIEKLAVIATPGYAYTNKMNVVSELRSTMLQVNCYCPNGWFQMRRSFANPNSFKYGVCILPVTLQATWTAAKFSCRNQWPNGFLVNEFTQTKHDYVLDAVKNRTAFQQPYTYFIGLSFSNGNWYWEQPVGEQLVMLQSWTDWNPTFPSSSSTKSVGLAVQASSNSLTTGWQNTDRNNLEYYVCEVAACDATNYCQKDND